MGVTVRRMSSPVVVLIAANVIFGLGLFFHAFLYNFYIEQLHLSEAVMGHAAAALMGGGLVALLPAGWLVDRVGPKLVVVNAALITTVGLALSAVVTDRMTIYGAAAVAGVGSGMWRVAVGPILMRLTEPDTRPRVFAWNVGLLVASGGLGMAVAGAVPGLIETVLQLAPLQAMRGTLLLGAGATALSVFLFYSLQISTKKTSGHREAGRSIAGSEAAISFRRQVREILPLVGFVAVWMVGPALVMPFFNIYFAREHGMPLEGIGLVFAVGQWLAALAVLVSGELATRFGLRRILATTLVFFAPAVWGLMLTTAIQLVVVLYFVQGLVSPVTNPLIDQLLFRLTPTERHGLVSSWRNAAADVSAMVGASTGGVLLAGETFALLFVTAGIVGLVGALVLVVGLRQLEYNVFDE